MFMKNKLFIIAALFVALNFPFNANALIADDITSANAGQTVEVKGENTENLTINKSITLKGSKTDKIIGNLTISGDNINVILDGFTVEGSINITASNSKVTLKNMNLNGKNNIKDNILVTVRALNSDISVDNTLFEGFIKAGIYAETLKNISVTNSTFNGIGTANIGSLEDYVQSNPEAEAILRSAACIDLNLGNQSSVQFALNSINIVNNHFEGIQNTAGADSTAGAVKIKLKNANNVTRNDETSVIIGANEFVKNADDVVIGTSKNPTTSDLLIAFYQNTSSENQTGIRVSNNGSATSEKEVIDSTVAAVRNYKDSTDPDQNGDLFIITINDKLYMVADGEALKEAISIDDNSQINLNEFNKKEGYTFKHFVEKGTNNIVDENTIIKKSMTIEAVFEKISDTKDEEENPKTSDNILIIGTLAIASTAIVMVAVKKIFVK